MAALSRAVGGKVILVTGASFGIGEHVARVAGRAGGRMLLVARTASRLEALAAEIAEHGGSAVVLPCDLNDDGAVSALAAELPTLAPDIIVSNAGKSIRRPVMHALDRPQDVTRTNNINFVAPCRLALAAIPGLVERRGQIINVSAINVLLQPAPGWAAYQASKTAFDQWLRSAAAELRVRGVAVTSVYLPLVRTRMIAPTRAYDRMPAMAPEQAARQIVTSMLTRRRAWAPWWLPPVQAISSLSRPLWERLMEWQQMRIVR
jgi:short-subunit dehydrogenase